MLLLLLLRQNVRVCSVSVWDDSFACATICERYRDFVAVIVIVIVVYYSSPLSQFVCVRWQRVFLAANVNVFMMNVWATRWIPSRTEYRPKKNCACLVRMVWMRAQRRIRAPSRWHFGSSICKSCYGKMKSRTNRVKWMKCSSKRVSNVKKANGILNSTYFHTNTHTRESERASTKHRQSTEWMNGEIYFI